MAEKAVLQITFTFLIIFLLSYLINFLWDSLVTVYFVDGSIPAVQLVEQVGYRSYVMGLFILGIYLFMTMFTHDVLWLKELNTRHVGGFILIALLGSFIWTYRSIFTMFSTAPWDSILQAFLATNAFPVFQMAISGILAIVATQHMLHMEGVFFRLT